MLETDLVGSGIDQPVVLEDCRTCNATVRLLMPPLREDSLGAVDRPKGVLELAGKALNVKNAGASLVE